VPGASLRFFGIIFMTEPLKDDWCYAYHVVAFLDVLGQKNTFSDVSGIPEDDAGKARLARVLKETVGFVRSSRETFDKICDRLSQSKGMDFPVQELLKARLVGMRKREIYSYGLADSFVAWSTLKGKTETERCKAVNGVFSVLSACAAMMAFSFARGKAIRGGINIDCAVKLFPDAKEIYGPGLNSAYVLECCAGWPRILIGKGMCDYLQEMVDSSGKSLEAKFCRRMAKKCQQLIFIDVDGQTALDYFGVEVMSIYSRVFTKEGILLPAKKFIETQIDMFSKLYGEESKRILDKYINARSYFLSRFPNL